MLSSLVSSSGTGLPILGMLFGFREASFGLMSNSNLVEVLQQIKRVLVHPISSSPFELILAVTTGKEADAQRSSASRCQQVPDTVSDYNRVLHVDFETPGRGQKQVRIRFRALHLVASNDRHLGANAKRANHFASKVDLSTGRDRPRHTGFGQKREQVPGSRKRSHLSRMTGVGCGMRSLKLLCLLRGYRAPGLSQQRVDQQAPAHADAAMNSPNGERNATGLQSFPPCQHMLVNTVHQRTVQIKEKSRRAAGYCHVSLSPL